MGRSKLPVLTKTDGEPYFDDDYTFVYGEPDHLRSGSDVAILAVGNMCHRALEARRILEENGISTAVYGISCPHCIGTELLSEISEFRLIATYEDHDRSTGLGASVALAMSGTGGYPDLLRFGVDEYGLSGNPEDLYRAQGLLAPQVAREIIGSL